MKCPKCGGLQQLIPVSKRTADSVWRKRVCKKCHHIWLTQEHISPVAKMPAEVQHFVDNSMRHTAKHKPAADTQGAPAFDTTALKSIRW